MDHCEFGSYLSRTFLVRYCEEEVEMNEGVVFRLEQDLLPVSEVVQLAERVDKSEKKDTEQLKLESSLS